MRTNNTRLIIYIEDEAEAEEEEWVTKADRVAVEEALSEAVEAIYTKEDKEPDFSKRSAMFVTVLTTSLRNILLRNDEIYITNSVNMLRI